MKPGISTRKKKSRSLIDTLFSSRQQHHESETVLCNFSNINSTTAENDVAVSSIHMHVPFFLQSLQSEGNIHHPLIIANSHSEILNVKIIPDEVWQYGIFQFLEPMSIIKMSRVSKKFQNCVSNLDDIQFWKRIQLTYCKKYIVKCCKNQHDKNVMKLYYENEIDKVLKGHKKIETTFKHFVINIYKNYLAEMRNGFKRIYLAMINEKEFHKLKIPKNGEVVSPRLFILFMESEKAIANAILCTYQDKSFPYEYIPSVFYNYDQGNVPFEYEDPLHEGTKSIALVKHLTLSVLYSQSFEYETLIRNCFINVTDCHVGLFNKLSRKSWEMMKSVLISNFGNSQQHILLMAVNWTILAHVPGMNSLKEKVNECCTDYIPHSEIEAYCSEHDISTFVDFKPQIEQDLVDIVEIIVKLLLLRVQHYNLFGKENLHTFSIFHVNKTRK